MIFQKLSENNVELYLDYLKLAMRQEPHMMTADFFDEEGIRKRIADPFFRNTTSILALEEGVVVGRIEFHFYGCMQDGCKMAYVDWVYVLPAHRHKGVAQSLFREFETACKAFGIHHYYLIRSERPESDRFYRAFSGVELSNEPLLRKALSV